MQTIDRKDILTTLQGLKLINDTAMITVLEGVHEIYLSNEKIINWKLKNADWMYVQKLFKEYYKAFIATHKHTMSILEGFVRRNTEDFVRFKND